MHIALGGALGDAHDVGDPLVALLFLNAQHQGQAMLRSQTHQRRCEVADEEPVLGLPVRARIAGGEDRPGDIRARIDAKILGTAPAQRIDRRVVGYP